MIVLSKIQQTCRNTGPQMYMNGFGKLFLVTFWQIVSGYSREMKARLLQFVTGGGGHRAARTSRAAWHLRRLFSAASVRRRALFGAMPAIYL